MEIGKANIVQAEFFHVGGNNVDSLEELGNEIFGRVQDGLPLAMEGIEVPPPLKTVVRFYDDDGAVTAFVKEAARLRENHDLLFEAFPSAGWFRRWWIDRQTAQLAGKIVDAKGEALILAIRQFAAAVQASKPIGVECLDHSFRPMKPEESHELVEKVEAAKSLWLFVFQPNDLLADSNKSIARLM